MAHDHEGAVVLAALLEVAGVVADGAQVVGGALGENGGHGVHGVPGVGGVHEGAEEAPAVGDEVVDVQALVGLVDHHLRRVAGDSGR